MSFTPHSTQSLAHRNLIAQLARKHKKVNKTKQYIVMEDPEKIAKDAEKVSLLFIILIVRLNWRESGLARSLKQNKKRLSSKNSALIDIHLVAGVLIQTPWMNMSKTDLVYFIFHLVFDFFLVDQDEDDLDQYGGTIRDDEEGFEDDEDREEMEEKRLKDAKRGVAESSFASAQKSKRLRIIEDSDSE